MLAEQARKWLLREGPINEFLFYPFHMRVRERWWDRVRYWRCSWRLFIKWFVKKILLMIPGGIVLVRLLKKRSAALTREAEIQAVLQEPREAGGRDQIFE
jgi:hypothetical protein